MLNGILIAVSESGAFQIVGNVSSMAEAKELIAGYMEFGPYADDCLAPDRFEIHSRARGGWYTGVQRIQI